MTKLQQVVGIDTGTRSSVFQYCISISIVLELVPPRFLIYLTDILEGKLVDKALVCITLGVL